MTWGIRNSWTWEEAEDVSAYFPLSPLYFVNVSIYCNLLFVLYLMMGDCVSWRGGCESLKKVKLTAEKAKIDWLCTINFSVIITLSLFLLQGKEMISRWRTDLVVQFHLWPSSNSLALNRVPGGQVILCTNSKGPKKKVTKVPTCLRQVKSSTSMLRWGLLLRRKGSCREIMGLVNWCFSAQTSSPDPREAPPAPVTTAVRIYLQSLSTKLGLGTTAYPPQSPPPGTQSAFNSKTLMQQGLLPRFNARMCCMTVSVNYCRS